MKFPFSRILASLFFFTLILSRVKAEVEICIIDIFQQIPLEYPQAIAASPDGNYLAVSSPDGIHLYNATSLEEEILITPATETSSGGVSLAWSRDGTYLASYISSSIGIVIWDIERQRAVATIPTNRIDPVDTIQSITWSPSGRYIAFTGTFLPVWIWDMFEEEFVLIESRANTRFSYLASPDLLAWHPLQDVLVYINGLEVRFWDSQGSDVSILNVSSLMDDVAGLSWSAEGMLAINGGIDNPIVIYENSIRLYSIINIDAEYTIINQSESMYPQSVTTLAWSPRGDLYSTAGDSAYTLQTGDVVIRNGTDSEIVAILTGGHPDTILDIEWSLDGQVLFSWSHDERPGNWTLLKWDIANECLIAVVEPVQQE